MHDPERSVFRLATLLARDIVDRLVALDDAGRVSVLVALFAVLHGEAPGSEAGQMRGVLLESVFAPDKVAQRLVPDLYRHLLRETARIVATCEDVATETGLGGPPAVTRFAEPDDIVLHNEAPDPKNKKKQEQWLEWQERLYRGIWWPGYQTAIIDLTQDDVALATAYLGGKLTAKGCPTSDLARAKVDKWNLAYKIVHGIEMVAGFVATVVLGVIFGPLGGLATTYLHKAKMAALDQFWKIKVAKDPAFKAAVEKLAPNARYSYQGFSFWLRPLGNMLMQELGCKQDLRTRLLLHGRMMRTIDVLAAMSPTAKPGPGLYDYPSSFGLLKGSIFPPRGPGLDGNLPTPKVLEQAKKVVAMPSIQAAIRQPIASLSATAEALTAAKTAQPPAALMRSAMTLRGLVERQQASQAAQAHAEKPGRAVWPYVLLGGAALGAAYVATRSSAP